MQENDRKCPAKRKYKETTSVQVPWDGDFLMCTLKNNAISTYASSPQPPLAMCPTSPEGHGNILHMKQANVNLHARLQQVHQEISNLQKTVSRLKDEKEILRSNIGLYQESRNNNGLLTNPSGDQALPTTARGNKQITPKECVSRTNEYVSLLQSHKTDSWSPIFVKNTCNNIAELLWDDDLFSGQLTLALVSKARTWFLNNDFAPYNILKAMDLRGGVLNYKGVEILRRCKTKGKKFVRNTAIPSTPGTTACSSDRPKVRRKEIPIQAWDCSWDRRTYSFQSNSRY
ncbi:hypothetical protein ACA910_018600 [Epithemia clementina (nom. ined.)]